MGNALEILKDLCLIHITLQEVVTATPGKQWAMNHALCEIGIRHPQFTERGITLGETFGVYRDLKVSKGCTSTYAPNWIAVGIKNRIK